MQKKAWVFIGIAAAFIALLFVFKYSLGDVHCKASVGSGWFFALVAIAALLDSINPCAFSVLYHHRLPFQPRQVRRETPILARPILRAFAVYLLS